MIAAMMNSSGSGRNQARLLIQRFSIIGWNVPFQRSAALDYSPEAAAASFKAASGSADFSSADWIACWIAADSSWYFGVVGRGYIAASPTFAEAIRLSWPDATTGLSYQADQRSEEHTSELQSQSNLVCRL